MSGSVQEEMAAWSGVVPVSGSCTDALPGVRRRGFREARSWVEAWRMIVWVLRSTSGVEKAGSSIVSEDGFVVGRAWEFLEGWTDWV